MSMNPHDMHLSHDTRSRNAVNPFATEDIEWPLNHSGFWQPPLFAGVANYQLPQQATTMLNRDPDHLLQHIHNLQLQLDQARAELANLPPMPLNPPNYEYDRRRQFREQTICRPNRVHKVYCAWHGTARIKSNQTPAPGHLSCDCLSAEALFEEELARNGVGSLTTGPERLHPELRRPLLQLLKDRFNYRDGDFDVDPATGQWKPGQGVDDWALRAATSTTSPH